MINKIKNLVNKIGIDEAIFYSILSRITQAGGGVVTLLFVAKSLSKVEQGYYYTFGSILAVQIFFELGLSTIITQFVAHENVSLNIENSSILNEDLKSMSRLSSLLRFTVRWFSVISLLLVIGLIITGFTFFTRFGDAGVNVDWKAPWIILSLSTSLSLLISPILAYLEGLGFIGHVTKIRFYQQIVQLGLVFLFFSIGFKLYTVPVAALLAFSIVPTWILLSGKFLLLKKIWGKLDEWIINYRLEIFPFQWKIALSWISGYFIFQLFNPVLFATEGAVVAGQMGMTLTVLNSIFSLAFSWISTKVPAFSNLIAKRDYANLDSLFTKTLVQSTILNALALLVFFAIIFLLRHYDIKITGKNFADRFLPFVPMLFMMLPILLNHIIGAWATYLRCHKEEPMLIQSVVIGILCSLSTIILGNFFGVIGITFGYMTLTIISFFWTYITFSSKKTEWHKQI